MIIVILGVVFVILACIFGFMISSKKQTKYKQESFLAEFSDHILDQCRHVITEQSQKQTIEIIKQMQEQKDQLFSLLQQFQVQQQKGLSENFQRADVLF